MYARKEMRQMESEKQAEVSADLNPPGGQSGLQLVQGLVCNFLSIWNQFEEPMQGLPLQKEAVWEAELAEEEQRHAPVQQEQEQVH